MGKVSKNSLGFSAVEVVLIMAIVAIIGFVGWYVYDAMKNTNNAYSSATTISTSSSPKFEKVTKKSTNQYAGWKSFCSSYGGLCLKYPTSWKLAQNTTNSSPAGPEIDTLSSPSGKTIVTYTPNLQQDGSKVSEKTYVSSVSPTTSTDFSIVQLINTVSGNPESFTANIFINPTSSIFVENPIQPQFLQGKTITSNTDTVFQFTSPYQPTSKFNQQIAVTENGNPYTQNQFSSYAAAQAWLTSSDTKTAVQILGSISAN